MLWFAQASVSLAGFLGKIVVALKNYFSLQFSLILGIYIDLPVPSLCILYIFEDLKYLKCLKKTLSLWITALNLPTCM